MGEYFDFNTQQLPIAEGYVAIHETKRSEWEQAPVDHQQTLQSQQIYRKTDPQTVSKEASHGNKNNSVSENKTQSVSEISQDDQRQVNTTADILQTINNLDQKVKNFQSERRNLHQEDMKSLNSNEPITIDLNNEQINHLGQSMAITDSAENLSSLSESCIDHTVVKTSTSQPDESRNDTLEPHSLDSLCHTSTANTLPVCENPKSLRKSAWTSTKTDTKDSNIVDENAVIADISSIGDNSLIKNISSLMETVEMNFQSKTRNLHQEDMKSLNSNEPNTIDLNNEQINHLGQSMAITDSAENLSSLSESCIDHTVVKTSTSQPDESRNDTLEPHSLDSLCHTSTANTLPVCENPKSLRKSAWTSTKTDTKDSNIVDENAVIADISSIGDNSLIKNISSLMETVEMNFQSKTRNLHQEDMKSLNSNEPNTIDLNNEQINHLGQSMAITDSAENLSSLSENCIGHTVVKASTSQTDESRNDTLEPHSLDSQCHTSTANTLPVCENPKSLRKSAWTSTKTDTNDSNIVDENAVIADISSIGDNSLIKNISSLMETVEMNFQSDRRNLHQEDMKSLNSNEPITTDLNNEQINHLGQSMAITDSAENLSSLSESCIDHTVVKTSTSQPDESRNDTLEPHSLDSLCHTSTANTLPVCENSKSLRKSGWTSTKTDTNDSNIVDKNAVIADISSIGDNNLGKNISSLMETVEMNFRSETRNLHQEDMKSLNSNEPITIDLNNEQINHLGQSMAITDSAENLSSLSESCIDHTVVKASTSQTDESRNDTLEPHSLDSLCHTSTTNTLPVCENPKSLGKSAWTSTKTDTNDSNIVDENAVIADISSIGDNSLIKNIPSLMETVRSQCQVNTQLNGDVVATSMKLTENNQQEVPKFCGDVPNNDSLNDGNIPSLMETVEMDVLNSLRHIESVKNGLQELPRNRPQTNEPVTLGIPQGSNLVPERSRTQPPLPLNEDQQQATAPEQRSNFAELKARMDDFMSRAKNILHLPTEENQCRSTNHQLLSESQCQVNTQLNGDVVVTSMKLTEDNQQEVPKCCGDVPSNDSLNDGNIPSLMETAEMDVLLNSLRHIESVKNVLQELPRNRTRTNEPKTSWIPQGPNLVPEASRTQPPLPLNEDQQQVTAPEQRSNFAELKTRMDDFMSRAKNILQLPNEENQHRSANFQLSSGSQCQVNTQSDGDVVVTSMTLTEENQEVPKCCGDVPGNDSLNDGAYEIWCLTINCEDNESSPPQPTLPAAEVTEKPKTFVSIGVQVNSPCASCQDRPQSSKKKPLISSKTNTANNIPSTSVPRLNLEEKTEKPLQPVKDAQSTTLTASKPAKMNKNDGSKNRNQKNTVMAVSQTSRIRPSSSQNMRTSQSEPMIPETGAGTSTNETKDGNKKSSKEKPPWDSSIQVPLSVVDRRRLMLRNSFRRDSDKA